MSVFGIRTSEFGSSDEHYIGEDNVLFDWLLANNYLPSERDSHYLVPVPVGYKFYQGSLVPEDSPEADEGDEGTASDVAYVSFGSPENDKALMLLEGLMKHVEPDEFYALNIDDERILDYMIY